MQRRIDAVRIKTDLFEAGLKFLRVAADSALGDAQRGSAGRASFGTRCHAAIRNGRRPGWGARVTGVAAQEISDQRNHNQYAQDGELLRFGAELFRLPVHCPDPSSTTNVSSFIITLSRAPPCCGVAFKLSMMRNLSDLSIMLMKRISSA